jgi:hypothetical protein
MWYQRVAGVDCDFRDFDFDLGFGFDFFGGCLCFGMLSGS